MLCHISFLDSLFEMKNELKTLLLPWIIEALSLFFIFWFKRSRIHVTSIKVRMVETKNDISLLDLPDLALDCILEKLSPSELSNMASVCNILRNMCVSDYFWERHLKHKWGRVIGDIAYREWICSIALQKKQALLDCSNQKGIFGFFPLHRRKLRTTLPLESIMSLYLSLESGKYWFPGQVFNRDNGNVGFVLSCYDAELNYDSQLDNFKARFSAQGRPTMEHDIDWDRIRASNVDTAPHDFHFSDCLDDLRPGDHIEIQWRRNKDFPYGWWYGVVGHLGPCNGCELHCQCHSSETVIIEFKQFTPGSQWSKTIISRKDHSEIGDEAEGFHGGLRKIYNEDEISMWQQIWPTKVIE